MPNQDDEDPQYPIDLAVIADAPAAAPAAPAAALRDAGRIPGLGLWTWDLRTGALACSAEAQRIFGKGCLDGSLASWLRCLDPEDAQALREIEEQVRAVQSTFSFEYGFTSPEGRRKRLKSDGEVAAVDAQGRPLVLAGTVLDLGVCPRAGAAGSGRAPRSGPARLSDAWTWQQDARYRFTLLQGQEPAELAELAHALGHCRWELPRAAPLRSNWVAHILTLQARLPFRGFEYRIGNGPQACYVSTSGDPVHDPSGAFLGYQGTAHDITPRVRAQEEARRAQRLFEHAMRLAHMGTWALRVPGMQVEWSHGSDQLFGRAGERPLTWQQALGHLAAGSRAALELAVSDCIGRGGEFSLEVRTLGHGRGARWLRISGEPEPSVAGASRRVVGVVKDISESKEAAQRVQELNERLVTTFESITEGFFTLDRQWRFTYVNHETERVTRLGRSDLLGRTLQEIFPWVVGGRFEQECAGAMATGQSTRFEAFAQALGVWLEVCAYPSSQGIAVYFQDVTEGVNALAALRASEERHRLLFEVSHDALLQVQLETGRIVSANPAACGVFGLTQAQICQQGRAALVVAHDQRLQALLCDVRATGRARGNLTLVRGDGTEFEAELSGVTFMDSDGVWYGSVAIRDISERVRHEAQILALNESLAQKVRERTAELEAANAELRGFARSLAHDLRTPIAAINALAHVLEQRLQTTAERERNHALRIRQAAQQLDQYVEALLSHARISQAALRSVRVDLSAMAAGILEDFRLCEPHRTVSTEVQPGLGAVGDPTLLRMALENLLGNAWKFTLHRAHAQIRFSGQPAADGTTTFCVSDNGAGFDMEHAHKLFGTFQRLHTHAEFPGTGVGLANVQRIVLRHGGRLWANGSPGAGASFHFTLPQEGPPAAVAPARGSPPA